MRALAAERGSSAARRPHRGLNRGEAEGPPRPLEQFVRPFLQDAPFSLSGGPPSGGRNSSPPHEPPEEAPEAGHEDEREQPQPEAAEVAAQQQGDGRAGDGPHPGGKSDRPVAPAARTGSLTVPHVHAPRAERKSSATGGCRAIRLTAGRGSALPAPAAGLLQRRVRQPPPREGNTAPGREGGTAAKALAR